MLQQLKEELKSSMAYSYFDMFNSVHDIVSNPTHYGTLRIKLFRSLVSRLINKN